ncbi:MAG: SIMPL domain-containing protein [Acidaminococcaceae bacterium]|nr:SIMPL domain-containing protein [Acidaminococcaceae bacterium]
MKRKFIALLLVMAAVFTFFCSSSFAAERDSISVNGHASAEVAPDMATLYGNLEKRAAVAETARENLAKDMASFRHMLLGQTIAGQDVQTIRYTLQPEYTYEKNKRRLTGYVARADYKVKIKDLEKLGAVIDKSIGCGFTVDRVEFGLNNRSLFENSLLEEAVANARSKAAVVARAGGRTLGRLIHAGFSTSGNVTHTVSRNMMAKAASMDVAEAAPTELDPGVIAVNANVDLEFALE